MNMRIIAVFLAIVTLFSYNVLVFAEDSGDYTNTVVDLFTEREVSFAADVAIAAINMEENYSFEEPVSTKELSRIMSIVYNDNPELFHLSSTYSYIFDTDTTTGETVITEVIFQYTMSPEDYAVGKDTIRRWADSVIALGDVNLSDEQWALFFHDYLASQYSYDYSFERSTVYEIIRDGIGVCQAYHLAYLYLLRAVGIECSFAVSDEMVHVWTMVNINGNWHHVDATWDDDMDGTWGHASHNYFLLCDHVISDEEGGHYNWSAKYTATCHNHTRDDLDFSDTSFVYGNGKWYYLHDGVLSVTDDPHTPGVDLLDLELKWHVWGDSGHIYMGTFSGLIFYDGEVIFNGERNLYAYDVQTGGVRILWKNDRDDGYIYGFKKIDDEIHISITTDPSTEGSEVIVKPFVSISLPGDANGDSSVDAADLQLLQRYIAGLSAEMDEIAADANGDGSIDGADVMYISRLIAGLSV